ncbi:Molybdenum-pterin-binding protein MopB [Pelotomaculum sp. FP]|uniref:winged helix-turn-helix domain-containing protein n=1 Tax=Pelotomaculum sp. FP TaxID=261474 RepID=UPI001066E988|nr:LysR family transcriptional regulator [Pelotomaculum sp. FP]TEB15835.1 Molybdenum-pterin-binding protein MopB [Pelotomaculum sp. FP]
MRLAYKIWLDNNGKVFGDGPYDLLLRVEQTGSLSKAAAEIGMSYNKAWRLIRSMEDRLGFPLLKCKAGGSSGGGSEVTSQALRLMQQYRALREEVENTLEMLYTKHFNNKENKG